MRTPRGGGVGSIVIVQCRRRAGALPRRWGAQVQWRRVRGAADTQEGCEALSRVPVFFASLSCPSDTPSWHHRLLCVGVPVLGDGRRDKRQGRAGTPALQHFLLLPQGTRLISQHCQVPPTQPPTRTCTSAARHDAHHRTPPPHTAPSSTSRLGESRRQPPGGGAATWPPCLPVGADADQHGLDPGLPAARSVAPPAHT